MNGICTNIKACNFRLCSYSINYYSCRKFCDVHILVLVICISMPPKRFPPLICPQTSQSVGSGCNTRTRHTHSLDANVPPTGSPSLNGLPTAGKHLTHRSSLNHSNTAAYQTPWTAPSYIYLAAYNAILTKKNRQEKCLQFIFMYIIHKCTYSW